MHIFINDLSLENQFYNLAEVAEAIRQFIVIVGAIRQRDQNAIFIHDSFIINRSFIQDEILIATFNRIDPDLRMSFLFIINRSLIDWRNQPLHDRSILYRINALSKNVTDTTIAEAAEYQLRGQADPVFILNFASSSFSIHAYLTVCKHIQPNSVDARIHCIFNQDQYDLHLPPIPRDLLVKTETDRFSKTSKISPLGSTIYLEVKTNRYWYFDTFHKTHYEVFDAFLNHVGEADLEGNLDRTKIDRSKNITL